MLLMRPEEKEMCEGFAKILGGFANDDGSIVVGGKTLPVTEVFTNYDHAPQIVINVGTGDDKRQMTLRLFNEDGPIGCY